MLFELPRPHREGPTGAVLHARGSDVLAGTRRFPGGTERRSAHLRALISLPPAASERGYSSIARAAAG